MSARAATGVAWVLVGLAAALVAVALGFIPGNGPLPWELWPLVSLALGFPVVGALVARRHSRHPIAWVYLVAGTAGALVLFTYGYAQYALVTRPGALPGGTAVAWLSAWVWVFGLTPVATFGLLLFPDGRPPSPRWRPVVWLAAAAVVLPVLANALMPGPLANHSVAHNPVGIPHAQPILEVAASIGLACFVVAALGSVAAVVVRFRLRWTLRRPPAYPLTARAAGLAWLCPPYGGVERPGRKVRFARLIDRPVRVLGGPAVRAACGGNLRSTC